MREIQIQCIVSTIGQYCYHLTPLKLLSIWILVATLIFQKQCLQWIITWEWRLQSSMLSNLSWTEDGKNIVHTPQIPKLEYSCFKESIFKSELSLFPQKQGPIMRIYLRTLAKWTTSHHNPVLSILLVAVAVHCWTRQEHSLPCTLFSVTGGIWISESSHLIVLTKAFDVQ